MAASREGVLSALGWTRLPGDTPKVIENKYLPSPLPDLVPAMSLARGGRADHIVEQFKELQGRTSAYGQVENEQAYKRQVYMQAQRDMDINGRRKAMDPPFVPRPEKMYEQVLNWVGKIFRR